MKQFIKDHWKTFLWAGVVVFLGLFAIFLSSGRTFKYSSTVEFARLQKQIDDLNNQLQQQRRATGQA